MQTELWINQPTVLFRSNKIQELWPTKTMKMNEKINALTRLIIVLSTLGYLITKNVSILITGIVLICILLVLNYIYNKRNKISRPIEGFAGLNQTNTLTSSPSKTNPMMNVLLPEIQDDPKRPPAAPSYRPKTIANINKSTQNMVVDTFDNPEGIEERLFKDLGDSFEFDRSMIQFNSNPSTTIPNDQQSFADFCYGDMISCKEGTSMACNQTMAPRWTNH
jgi:hypothetical protein